MKALTILCNVVLAAMPVMEVVTEGLPERPSQWALAALIVLVPIVTVCVLTRKPARGRASVPGLAALCSLVLLGLAAASPQAPGKPREVRRLYWEIEKRSDVYVRLIPEAADGGKPFVSLTFRADFPGVAKRNPHDGLPEWPAGPPARLTLTAEPLPLVLIKELALSLEIDGRAVSLTPPGGRYRNIPCLVASGDCTPFGVEAEIDRALLESLLEARAVEGRALGFPVRLTKDDLAAVGEFASRVGLAPGRPPVLQQSLPGVDGLPLGLAAFRGAQSAASIWFTALTETLRCTAGRVKRLRAAAEFPRAMSDEVRARNLCHGVTAMRKAYDLGKARPNPYAKRSKRSVTSRLDEATRDCVKSLAGETGIPYQTLINS